MWRVWGERYDTADMSNTRVYQPAQFPKNYVLLGCRIWVIAYNDPVFTSLHMKIYSDNNGVPKKLLHTSTNVQLKADIHTLDNAAKEIWFDFDKIPVRGEPTLASNKYHFVLNGSGYTGDETSHLAWMRGFPNPVYRPAGFGYNDLLTSPLTLYFIGSRL